MFNLSIPYNYDGDISSTYKYAKAKPARGRGPWGDNYCPWDIYYDPLKEPEPVKKPAKKKNKTVKKKNKTVEDQFDDWKKDNPFIIKENS